MNYGFVKVAAAVPHVQVADCFYNIQQMEGLMRQASDKGVQIIAFPEMSVTAYTCLDLFAQQALLKNAEQALLKLVSDTADLNTLTIAGAPLVTENRLINAAVAFQSGKILGVVPKTYIPNYKEFQEQRWFTSATELRGQDRLNRRQNISVGQPLALHRRTGKSRHRNMRRTCGFPSPQFPADDGRSQYPCQYIRQQRTDRKTSLPPFADMPAVRPLHGRVCLCLRRFRRIQHRPCLCRQRDHCRKRHSIGRIPTLHHAGTTRHQ